MDGGPELIAALLEESEMLLSALEFGVQQRGDCLAVRTVADGVQEVLWSPSCALMFSNIGV